MTLKNGTVFSDKSLQTLFKEYEERQKDQEVLEGEVVDEPKFNLPGDRHGQDLPEEEKLRRKIESGEWDNLDDCQAFQKRTPEGQIMARAEAIDFRIRQLETRLPLLLNRDLTSAYVQVLKRIRALRMTKTGMLALFYQDYGQKDLDSGSR